MLEHNHFIAFSCNLSNSIPHCSFNHFSAELMQSVLDCGGNFNLVDISLEFFISSTTDFSVN